MGPFLATSVMAILYVILLSDLLQTSASRPQVVSSQGPERHEEADMLLPGAALAVDLP